MTQERLCRGCSILVVDDDANWAHTLKRFLEQQGCSVEAALSGAEALDVFDRTHICLAMIDMTMPLMDGLTLMRQLREKDPELAVMIMTGFATIETAVDSIKHGAEDYITKPLDPEVVLKKIKRLMEVFQLRTRVAELEAAVKEDSAMFESLIYISPSMHRVVERARAAAASDASILITGETGTGKEILARAIHAVSRRRSAPFVAVNCGALPRELVESELFGHRRGSFTGAYSDSPGIFASAAGGTVFLDEIGEMPKDLQVKLLRVLQEKECRPLGGTRPTPVDVRVIAASNRSITDLRSSLLREDLYYRIAAVVIDVPPLRSRPEDILVLSQRLLKRISERDGKEISLNRAGLDLLLTYSFPGNVRELQNILEGASVLARGDPLVITDKDVKSLLQSSTSPAVEQPLAIEPLEHMAIQRALRIANGNRTKAAALLGISRETLYRRLRQYESDRARFEQPTV